MFPFFESIALIHGRPRNLELHQQRVDRTLQHHYTKANTEIHLPDIIQSIRLPEKGIHKLNFSYDAYAYECKFTPYRRKRWKKFNVIEDHTIQYQFKYTDRKVLEKYKKYPDELLLFIQHGELTDTEYSNIVLRKDNIWYTPKNCLLTGIMRTKLLLNNKIVEESILLSDMKNYSHFKCINAMNSLEEAIEYNTDVIPVAANHSDPFFNTTV